MSREYGIYVTLELPFTQENVHFILRTASTSNFIYIAENKDKEIFNKNIQYLTIDQATIKILHMAANIKPYELPLLQVRYQDTNFSFRLYENENKLICIGACIFGPRWDKIFKHGLKALTIDFARYIRVLLNICNNITLLELETDSDLIEDVQYTDRKCITVLVYINEEGFADLINNGFENKFIFFDEITNQIIEPSVYKGYETFIAGFPIYLYAKKNNVTFKFEIKGDIEQGFDFISIYPLEPYLMKKGYGSEEEKIDVAFYIERLLEFCESFAIYEIRTFL